MTPHMADDEVLRVLDDAAEQIYNPVHPKDAEAAERGLRSVRPKVAEMLAERGSMISPSELWALIGGSPSVRPTKAHALDLARLQADAAMGCDQAFSESEAREMEATLENAAAAMTDLRKRAERSEAEVQRLQAALHRWLPMVRGDDDPAAEDAMLLFGLESCEGPDLGEAIVQRAERAESALEAMRGQVEGLATEFSENATHSRHKQAVEVWAYIGQKLAALLAIKERMG